MADYAFQRYERIVLNTQIQLELLIQQGEAKPLLLWHALLPLVLPIIALLVPRRTWGWLLRPILSVTTLSVSLEIIRYRRVLLGANGYMIGLIMVWWLVWSMTLLVFNDVERDFRRIVRTRSTTVGDKTVRQNGHASNKEHKQSPVTRDTETLVWKPYPQSLLPRLGWVIALVLNMRGPDFSFRISSLDPLPPLLDPKHHSAIKKPACPSATIRLRAAFLRFFIAYLAIDFLKLIIIWDPYFFGALSAPPPFPFDCFPAIPGLVSVYHSIVSGTAVYFALQYVTSLNPIFFLGLSSAFPNASRALTVTPLDAPWLYADQFGPITAVLDDGLAGAWSKWWHQIFRFGFVSTSKWLISLLPSTLSSHRSIRRIIITLVAFGISGLMHGSGSYTQIGETRPFSGTFLFFFLQPVGISIQGLCSRIIVTSLARHGLPPPRWLRRFGNVTFVLGWLLFTGNRIADDFANGKMWLTEPLPFSLLRGLMGRGWVCWRTPWFEHYDDGTFWGRGVRIL
ncbi:membrane bound O-acyl transferase family-domain-containing protein [Aspergillus cavernicola]|uniref:Membrane bound O-acyl transferase family-domain-containing protein n=1 Tax=Aspergillus cavernicola TaxID=176166 RepID=A0ABR4ID26_9EURO